MQRHSFYAVVYLHPTATHISLTLEQQIANELGGNLLGAAVEEGVGGGWRGLVAMGVAGWRSLMPAANPITDLKTPMPQHFAAR